MKFNIKNLIPLLLIFILFSCQPKGDWMDYKFSIENGENLSKAELENFNATIQAKLKRMGFAESTSRIQGEHLMVHAMINLESEVENDNFMLIFESNKLEFWHTHKVTDPLIKAIDRSKLNATGFIPYYEIPGHLQDECFGICYDANKKDEIISTLNNQIELLKLRLFWTELKSGPEYDRDQYQLIMINTDGKINAPITEADIKEVSANKSAYDSRLHEIWLTFKESAAKEWTKMTTYAASNGNRSIAIIVNDEVYSVPRVNQPITGGRSAISGDFDKMGAELYARKLRSGRLDHKLKLLSVKKEATGGEK
ncbi:hypothetical protein N9B82_03625 [Saprospiraceae bacterium]|nr:hypothetical protein [Saprospiraceae bacterium]